MRPAPGPALRRPAAFAIVVFLEGQGAFRQVQPGLLGGSVDVDVGRQAVGIVQRADAHAAVAVAGPGLVSPSCKAARREERRTGKECASTMSSWWSTQYLNKTE